MRFGTAEGLDCCVVAEDERGRLNVGLRPHCGQISESSSISRPHRAQNTCPLGKMVLVYKSRLRVESSTSLASERNESTFLNSCSFPKFAAKPFCFDYGARKYPEMSITTCVGFDPKMLMEPFAVGTIAMLDVIAPSMAFRVETSGCGEP